jgi:hypothetical protein
VRRVAATRRAGEALERVQRALVEVLSATYPQYVASNPMVWPRARRLDAHALALVDGDDEQLHLLEGRVAYLLEMLGIYKHRAQGQLAAARSLRLRALAIREKVLGPEHPYIRRVASTISKACWTTRASWRRRRRSTTAR